MRKVLIIAPYTLLPGEMGFNRFHYIATELVKRGCNVTLVTSNFIHPYKKFRDYSIANEVSYNLVLMNERGYKKNFSFDRIFSHVKLENNIKRYLHNLTNKPDVIYCAYPLMKTAYYASKYAKKNGIPIVLDIQDIWPDSFNVVFKLPDTIFSIIIYPFTRIANKIYSMADFLFAVSETYLRRAQKYNKLSQHNSCSVFIGADLDTFDIHANHPLVKDPNEIWLIYIGTLSYSYDLETVIKASAKLKTRGYKEIVVKVLGEGPDEVFLKKKAKELEAPVDFLGFKDYIVMATYLNSSDIALNALTKKSQGSITNKLGDFLAAGLPVLNSCKNEEVINLINNSELGLNYEPGDSDALASKVEYLLNNKDKLVFFGRNSRGIAEEKFNRKNSYEKIFQIIEQI